MVTLKITEIGAMVSYDSTDTEEAVTTAIPAGYELDRRSLLVIVSGASKSYLGQLRKIKT